VRARDRLVQLYLPVVEAFANRYRGRGAEYEDLVQVGSTALLNAIERCDPKRGDEFAAFAVPTVAGEIRQHLRDRAQSVRLPQAAPAATAAGQIELDDRILHADAFQSLDDTERSIVYLRFVQEVSGRETATQLGMSEDRLERRTRSALTKLRGDLERSAFPGPQPERARSGDESAGEADTSEDPPPAGPSSGADDGQPAAQPKNGAHSGRILVRMPQTLHGELAQAAERERVSLNQFITNALSAAVGWQRPHEPERKAPRWLPAAIVTNIVVLAVAGLAALILLLVALERGL
jgi:RNA polymerase sigma-B factor